jgi:biopolymer transport protein ExbD
MRRHRTFTCSFLVLSLVTSLAACGEKKDEAAPPSGPIVGVLELPVSLRTSAPAPADAHDLEISPTEIHVAGQPVMMLANGVVAASDRQGNELPKLAAALKTPMRSRIALSASAQVPYETVVLVLQTAKSNGIRGVSFKVRPPGGSTTTGFLELDDFQVQPKSKSDEEVQLQSVAVRPWSDFVTRWEEVQTGCRGAMSGSCAFKPEKVAEGGNLKIILHTAGQGVNVDFFRVGAPPPEAEKPKEKVKMIEGVKAMDIVADVEQAPPATEASFQFRATEALANPSPVSATVKPVCGTSACGVFVTAEKTTLLVRVVSLLGAAFPDGTPAPIVAFELP